MSKKKRSRKEDGLMKAFCEDIWKEGVQVAPEDVVFAAYHSNSCPDEMMEKAFRSGKISQEEWQDWIASKEFCERYQ